MACNSGQDYVLTTPDGPALFVPHLSASMACKAASSSSSAASAAASAVATAEMAAVWAAYALSSLLKVACSDVALATAAPFCRDNFEARGGSAQEPEMVRGVRGEVYQCARHVSWAAESGGARQ